MRICKNNRKMIMGLLACIFLMVLLVPTAKTQAAKKITSLKVTNVTDKKLRISAGKTYTFKTSIAPTSATNQKLSWSSSKKSVATISSSGKLTAKKKGTTTITVKTTDGSNKSVKIKVTVLAKSKTIQKITLQTTTKQKLIVGETYNIETTVSPSSLAKNGVSYTSSNKKVITVTSSGKVKAVGSGTAKITVKAKDSDTVKKTLTFQVKSYSQLSVKDTQAVAHMGLIYEAPSNSVPSFEKAASSNAFMGIESDLRETKDGNFVMIHDENISSRTNGSGVVSKLTLQQVVSAAMNRGTNISYYKSLRIPTLQQYLEVCKENDMIPVIHIKNISSYGKFISILKEYGFGKTAIITGSKAVMTKFRSLDKNLNLSWLCYMTKSGIDWAAENNININTDYTYVSQELCDYAHSKGLTVGAWTVNDYNTAKRVLYKGVDFITTDYKFATYK